MRKAFSIAIASALLATSAIGTTAAADSRHSRFQQQDRVVQDYCNNNGRDDSCRDWSRNRNNWDEAEYHGWYRDHYRSHDNRDDDTIAGLFGFAAGVITGSIANGAGMSLPARVATGPTTAGRTPISASTACATTACFSR